MNRAWLILLSILVSACAVRQGVPVGEIPPFTAPEATAVQGNKAAVSNALVSEGKAVSSTGEMHARAQGIIDRLSRAAGAANFHFPVLVADAGDEVNAMVADGKTVVVYKTLMTRVPDDAELATVLAHEIGHVLGKHNEDTGSKDRKNEVSIASSVLGTLAHVGLAVAGFGGLGRLAGSVTKSTTSAVGMGSYALAYDREMEYEADHIGMMLMSKAGYDPEAAIRFWSNSDKIFGGANSLSFFSTHPSNSDRLNRLREYLPIAQNYYRNSKTGPTASVKAATTVVKPKRK